MATSIIPHDEFADWLVSSSVASVNQIANWLCLKSFIEIFWAQLLKKPRSYNFFGKTEKTSELGIIATFFYRRRPVE